MLFWRSRVKGILTASCEVKGIPPSLIHCSSLQHSLSYYSSTVVNIRKPTTRRPVSTTVQQVLNYGEHKSRKQDCSYRSWHDEASMVNLPKTKVIKEHRLLQWRSTLSMIRRQWLAHNGNDDTPVTYREPRATTASRNQLGNTQDNRISSPATSSSRQWQTQNLQRVCETWSSQRTVQSGDCCHRHRVSLPRYANKQSVAEQIIQSDIIKRRFVVEEWFRLSSNWTSKSSAQDGNRANVAEECVGDDSSQTEADEMLPAPSMFRQRLLVRLCHLWFRKSKF